MKSTKFKESDLILIRYDCQEKKWFKVKDTKDNEFEEWLE